MEPEGSKKSDKYLVDAWNNYHHSMDQANKAAKSLGTSQIREASKKVLMRKTKAQLIDMIVAMEQTPPQADWKERYDNAREDISRLREKYQKTVHRLHESDRRIATLEQANSELQDMIRHEEWTRVGDAVQTLRSMDGTIGVIRDTSTPASYHEAVIMKLKVQVDKLTKENRSLQDNYEMLEQDYEYLRKQKAVESNNKEFDKQGPKNRFDRQEAEIARRRAAFRFVASAGVFGLTLLGTIAATLFLSTGDELVFNVICGVFGSLSAIYAAYSMTRANVLGGETRRLDYNYGIWLQLKEEKELEEHEAKLKAAEKELEA